MNRRNLKKLISGVAFVGLLFFNVPVYANVSPTTVDDLDVNANTETTEEVVTENETTTNDQTTTNDESTTTTEDNTTTTDEESATEEDTTTTDEEVTTEEDTTTTDEESATEEDTTTTDEEVTTEEDTTTTDEESATEEDTTTTDEETTTEEDQVGIAPDSALYVLDKLFESIQISLTFDDVNKAALLASISEERLAEVNYLIDKANTEEVNQEEWDQLLQQVVDDYKETLNNALASVEEIAIDIDEEEQAELDAILESLENSATVDEELIENDEELQEITDRAILVANVVSDLDQEKVAEIREQGLGLGQISQVFALAEATGKDVDEVAKLFTEQGMGYGDAAKELGISTSDLAKKKVEEKKAKKNKGNQDSEIIDEETEIDDINEENDVEVTEEENGEQNGDTIQVENQGEETQIQTENKAQEKKNDTADKPSNENKPTDKPSNENKPADKPSNDNKPVDKTNKTESKEKGSKKDK